MCGGAAPPAAPVPGFERGALRRALAEARPTAGWADLTACVAAAARALSEGPAAGVAGKRLVVATDLTASAWRLEATAPMVTRPEGPVRPEVTVLDAARGADLPNRSLAELAVAPDPGAGPRGFRLTATVAASAGTAGAHVR